MFFRSYVKKFTSVVSTGVLAVAGVAAGQDQSTPVPQQDTSQQVPPQQQYPPQAITNARWAAVGQGQNPSAGQGGAMPGQQNGSYSPPVYNAPGGPVPYGSQPSGNAGPYGGQVPYNQGPYTQGPSNQQPMQPVPAQVTIPAGTFVTVRVNQTLSSDHNQPGDGFSATLVQPVVANGIVIAEPGQTMAGQVLEAQKAGRVEGVARLKVQLTEMTLVDGQQLPVQSAFVSRSGGTSIGRDASAIAGTTGLGAAIGAAAGWGTGAAIGAGAGAVVGTIGVLVTRGRPSVIVPEQILTFRIEAPISIDTTHATQAFRYVQPNEYDRPVYNQPAPYSGYNNGPVVVASAPYYGYGYPYGYPYAYGPGFSFFFGSGYYNRSYYGGRGFYGGGFRRR